MIARPDLPTAFAAAMRAVERRLAAGGADRAHCERLLVALAEERRAALARGGPDAEWVKRTVREVVAWAPEDDLTLIAAIGGIARATGTGT